MRQRVAGKTERRLAGASQRDPFVVQLPPNLPSSVVMNQNKGRDANNEHLGVDYEVTGFVGSPAKAVPRRRRSTVRLNIRKLAHVSAALTGRPTATETKSFMLSSKAMRLQVTLSKPVCPAAIFPSSDRLPTSPCSCGPCPLAVTLCGEI